MSANLPANIIREEANLLAVVMRAASDPHTDADKLEKLLAIGTHLQQEQAKAEFNACFAALKKELPVIEKKGTVLNKSGKVQFKYARYDELYLALHPLLEKHGFTTSYNFEEPSEGRLTCILELSHTNRFNTTYSKFYHWTLPSMGQNQYVTNLQNAAAARTFGKRCVLIDALDILTKDTDLDGAAAPPPEVITEDQARKIEDLLAACEQAQAGATPRFLKWLRSEMQVDQIRQLRQGDQQETVMRMLKAKADGLGIK